MSLSDYTEDTLVQQTTAEYLESALGWESVYAYNNETFGPDGTLGRAADALNSLAIAMVTGHRGVALNIAALLVNITATAITGQAVL